MRILTLFLVWHTFMLYAVTINSQSKFNITGGSQILFSSDWSDGPKYDYSIMASLEVPLVQKLKDFCIVPNIRWQKDDLSYEYLSFNHTNTQKILFDMIYYEYGQLLDVKFSMDKYLLGANIQRRIVDQLYFSIGSGIAINFYNNLEGLSKSNFHYYQIDLSQYKIKPNWNIYYSANLQYKFPVMERLDIIFAGAFIYNHNLDINELNIFDLYQYSFHFELGGGYSF